MSRTFVIASSQYLVGGNVKAATPFSVTALFDFTSTVAQTLFSLANNTVPNQFFRLRINDTSNVSAQSFAAASASAAATDTITANVWSHAGGAFRTSTSRDAYHDGANKGSNTTSSAPTGVNSSAIGRVNTSTPAGYCGGMIAEVGVYDAALSDDQLGMLGKSFSPL